MINPFDPNINFEPHLNDILFDTIRLCQIIQASGIKPSHIVGVSRGGLIPSVFMSHNLKLPLIPVCFSGSEGAGDDKTYTEIEVLPEFDKKDVILIVDDICDTGDTLSKMVKYYKRQKIEVYTAVLYFKDNWPTKDANEPTHGYIPTFYMNRIGPLSQWVVFPWQNPSNLILNQIQQQV